MELLVLIVVVMLVANFASLVLESLRAGERDRRRVRDAQSIGPASSFEPKARSIDSAKSGLRVTRNARTRWDVR
jgi:hypothetical protein